MELIAGIILATTALVLAMIVLFAPGLFHAHHPTADRAARAAQLRLLGDRAADAAERRMSGGRISFITEEALELAGTKIRPGNYIVITTIVTALTATVGSILAAASGLVFGWLAYLLFVVAVPLGGRVYLSYRTNKRRAAFADQLDDTLQLIANGLRAGHSLARAIDAVSREAESPTAEEFARIINENRLGRDLGESIMLAAKRMKSDDLAWTAQAVNIHREVGGNLSEVLDHVAETIRERNQIRRQVATLSSEGRMSANVLMALPVAIALFLTVVTPSYLAMFVTTPLGVVLFALSVVLFIIGGIWMRSVTKIKF